MTYYVIDLPVGDTAESIYAWQNEDLFSRREHVEVVDEEQVIKGNGRTITTTLFSAERDNKKNYYYSCLVQLDENEEVFAWVIVTAMPSYMMQNQDEFIEMMKTMEYIEEKETLPENVI